MTSNITVRDYYSKGWTLFRSHLKILLPMSVVITLIMALTDDNLIKYLFKVNVGLGIIAIVYSFLIAGPIKMSTSWTFLKAARKEKFVFSDMFAVFHRNYKNAVLAVLMWVLLFLVGLALLVLPSIIVAIRLIFVDYLVIGKNMKAWDAIKLSWEMTKGHSWIIFKMGLLSILICIGGFLLLGVGLFPAIGWIGATYAEFYKQIAKKH